MSLISVIVPVYNAENYLNRCIESLLIQTHECLEIILVDDCSNDKSADICDGYANKDSRIKVIHKQQNGGVSNARNSGIAIAKGEYIAFVDNDDFIEPNMYELLLKKAKENNSLCVMCGFFYEKKDDRQEDKSIYSLNENLTCNEVMDKIFAKIKEIDFSLMRIMLVWNKLWSKKILTEISFLPYGGEDINFFVRAMDFIYKNQKGNSISVVKQPLYHWNIRENSTSNKKISYYKASIPDMFHSLLKVDICKNYQSQIYFYCIFMCYSVLPNVNLCRLKENREYIKKLSNVIKNDYVKLKTLELPNKEFLFFAKLLYIKMPIVMALRITKAIKFIKGDSMIVVKNALAKLDFSLFKVVLNLKNKKI